MESRVCLNGWAISGSFRPCFPVTFPTASPGIPRIVRSWTNQPGQKYRMSLTVLQFVPLKCISVAVLPLRQIRQCLTYNVWIHLVFYYFSLEYNILLISSTFMSFLYEICFYFKFNQFYHLVHEFSVHLALYASPTTWP